jgi:uncharacterized membrane protein YgdD (TMEM256/DUF423 family)
MHKKIYFWAAIFGFLAVLIGAFGSHFLKQRIDQKEMLVFQTGVEYHFFHVFALIFTGVYYKSYRHAYFYYAAICFGIGIILFSFSIYIMKLSILTTEGEEKWLSYFTPFGGFLFLAGWGFIAIYFSKEREKQIRNSKSVPE